LRVWKVGAENCNIYNELTRKVIGSIEGSSLLFKKALNQYKLVIKALTLK
jgi:hypothetical protein